MKKYVIAISMLIALPVAAQETYENANIVTEELNGTARYVGMGRPLNHRLKPCRNRTVPQLADCSNSGTHHPAECQRLP